MLLDVGRTKRLLDGAKKVLVAASGGQDSMCLLHAFWTQKDALGVAVAVVTVNHNLRGAESDRDAAFVAEYCRQNGIDCQVVSVRVRPADGEKGGNLEQEARNRRYDAFAGAANACGADKVATAHHASDNAESVLLNLFRGAGTAGASGIGETYGKLIIRPLLHTPKTTIAEYAATHGIPYRTDASNQDTSLNRNYVRHEIMPRIAARFPHAEDSLNAFAARAALDEQFIAAQLPELKAQDGAVRVPLAVYTQDALGVRATRRALELLGGARDVTAAGYADVGALKNRNKGAVILLPGGVRAVRGYAEIVFSRAQALPVPPYEIPYREGVVVTPYGRIECTRGRGGEVQGTPAPCGDRALYIAPVDLDRAVWRNRRSGDTFAKFGGGKKKLNDYFTDKKLSDDERDRVPLLVLDGRILAVAGMEIADSAKVTDGDYIRIVYTRMS